MKIYIVLVLLFASFFVQAQSADSIVDRDPEEPMSRCFEGLRGLKSRPLDTMRTNRSRTYFPMPGNIDDQKTIDLFDRLFSKSKGLESGVSYFDPGSFVRYCQIDSTMILKKFIDGSRYVDVGRSIFIMPRDLAYVLIVTRVVEPGRRYHYEWYLRYSEVDGVVWGQDPNVHTKEIYRLLCELFGIKDSQKK
jgi:hypothetical protein